MEKGSTLVLKGVVMLVGGAVLALCVFVIPQALQYADPWGYSLIPLGMYMPALPFFLALNETLKLLRYIDRNEAFSDLSVESLRRIKRCGIAIALIYTTGLPYIVRVAELDDAPGVVLIALIIISASLVVSVFAAVLQRLLNQALAIKSENDLTV